jgi:hypothetical protein
VSATTMLVAGWPAAAICLSFSVISDV